MSKFYIVICFLRKLNFENILICSLNTSLLFNKLTIKTSKFYESFLSENLIKFTRLVFTVIFFLWKNEIILI